MDKISQSGIKNENMRLIFDAIASSERGKGINRADISKKVGLSLMTVGKVADVLMECGVAVQVKPATGNAGRRAGMLDFSDDFFIFICDVSDGGAYHAEVFNLRLEKMCGYDYTVCDSFLPEENLMVFLRSAGEALIKGRKSDHFVGMGVCISGKYNEAEDIVGTGDLAGVKIKAVTERTIGIVPSVVENNIRAAAISQISSDPLLLRGQNVFFYLRGSVAGCVSTDGEVLPTPDFASIPCYSGRKLGVVIAEENRTEILAAEFCSALFAVFAIIDPNRVIVNYDPKKQTTEFPKLVRGNLEKLGRSAGLTFDGKSDLLGPRGVALAVRKKWLFGL